MPKQNRPLVRDGRLQVKKKRTDRSYLRPGSSPETEQFDAPTDADLVEDPTALAVAEEAAATEPEIALLADGVVAMPNVPETEEPPRTSRNARAMAAAPAASVTVPRAGVRLPNAVRALQQQGVRKRRDVDLAGLARRDTDYAMHELRRIAILASMVVITLIVLAFVLR